MIPRKLREEMADDPYYKTCARANQDCRGRTTWEHAFTYAGRKIQEHWAIIPLCWRHHLGDLLDKKINRAIAISRASDKDLKKYPLIKRQEYNL